MSPDSLRAALAELVAKGDFEVPPYPAVALRLQRIFERENYHLGDISDTIAADPALAARVLGVTNSALYHGAQDIVSLPRAVNRLGARVVSALALAAGLGASATQAGALFDVKYRVWRRSVTSALICQKLAPLRGIDADEAFLLGLIHGFGRSVAVAALERLVMTRPPVAPLVLLQWLAVAEEQRAELALAVAERWQLPAEILTSLRPTATPTPLGALVTEADRIATGLESSWRVDAASPAEAQAVEELIRGLPAALDALAAVPLPPPKRATWAVKPTEHALHGELRACQIPVIDCRKKGAAVLSSVGVSPTGIELKSSMPLQEGSMVRLAVGAGDERFEAWFNVLVCIPSGAGCRVEAELFSPPHDVKERWRLLHGRATAAA